MATIKNTSVSFTDGSTTTITVPQLAFAFSDSRMTIMHSDASVLSVTVVCGLTEKRTMHNNSCEFDLLPFILYNQSTVNLGEVNGSPSPNKCRGSLILAITMTQSGGDTSTAITVPYVFGSFGIDDHYSATRFLTYFTGQPMTIDIEAVKTDTEDAHGNKGNFDFCTVTADGLWHAMYLPVVANSTRYSIGTFGSFSHTLDIITSVQDIVNGSIATKSATIHIEKMPTTFYGGVHVRWIDNLGRLNYYFFKRITNTTTVKASSSYQRSVQLPTDFTAYTSEYYMAGMETYAVETKAEKVTLAASNVDKYRFAQLLTLASSPCVDWYRGVFSGKPKWERVMVTDASYTFNPHKDLQDFVMTLALPSGTIQNW
jgi:hypothetical protein